MTPSSERSIKGLLNAFSWAGSGSVKGACGMVMCGGEGIHLPLTGSGQHLPWRLWPLMGHHRKLLITFLNNAYFIRVKTNENLGDEHYKGPFFKIKNNSSDTLYGEHLPGYFWGTLSYIRNDSTLFTRIGILDYEFVDSPPLYPDSTKYATVGSFGLTKKLIPFEYRFELMLANKWQSQGIGIYDERKDFIWWAGTKEYLMLRYDFKIDK